jgi:hypothetical protein
VTLREATAQMVDSPEIVFGGEAILINRARLEVLCLIE